MTATDVSPASSPRLPSPPPIAEDQLGPMSPLPTSDQQKGLNNIDHGASRRIRPGTKAEDMADGPPLVDLAEIDSAFQLTEHLKALHQHLTHPAGSDNTIPVDRTIALKLAYPPENVDKTLWLYELCRFLSQKVNIIIVALFSDNPPCSAQTCPEMRASEWQYLCAVHDPPKACCAIDYCCHTLDWAANVLTSLKTFPSRLALGRDQDTQVSQVRHLTSIFRRVYRVFAHAWFQHRDIFWRVEGRTGLYVFFKTVCDLYGLIPDDGYTIPPEAAGETYEPITEVFLPPKILKREPSDSGPEIPGNSSIVEGVSELSLSTAGAGTTKRHRHSPSVGATSVTTVVEENEDEDAQSGKQPPSQLEAHFSISEPAIEEPATTSGEAKAESSSAADETTEAPAAKPAEEASQAESEKEIASAGTEDKDNDSKATEASEKEVKPDTPLDAPAASETTDEVEEGQIIETPATTSATEPDTEASTSTETKDDAKDDDNDDKDASAAPPTTTEKAEKETTSPPPATTASASTSTSAPAAATTPAPADAPKSTGDATDLGS